MASKDLVQISDYRALQDSDRTAELIRQTLDGQQLREFDLARVRLSTAAGGQTLQVPGLNGVDVVKDVSGVILFNKHSRSWWESRYDGSNDPPDCSAPDAKHATARPDVAIPAPQDESRGEDAYLCDGCAYAEWGSALREDGSPSRGQACKMTRQLFLLTPQRMLPMVLTLPPTSLKEAQSFFLNLADFDVDYRQVVVKITAEKKAGKGVPDFNVAKFEVAERLDDDQFAKVVAYAQQMEGAFRRIVADRADVEATAA